MALSRAKEAKLVGKADQRGERAGRNAAAWVFDDGRSRATPADYRRWLERYEAGYADVMDIEPAWLSGEWAGESVAELLGDLFEEAESAGANHEFLAHLEECYAASASDAFWNAVVQEAEMRATE